MQNLRGLHRKGKETGTNTSSESACVRDLAKWVQPIPVVDASLAPSNSFEGAGGLAPQPFWPVAAGTG